MNSTIVEELSFYLPKALCLARWTLPRHTCFSFENVICSTLTLSRSGKENPCYTQIRLQKIRILEIRELHNEWLQCG